MSISPFLVTLFNIWGITIQFTTAMGFVVPLISTLIPFAKKSHLQQSMK